VTRTTSFPGGSTTTLVEEPIGRTDAFTFSGFGSNDKRRHVLPTAGEYNIVRYDAMQGTANVVVREFGAFGLDVPRIETYREGMADNMHGDDLGGYFNPQLDSTTYNTALSRLWDQIKASELDLTISLAELRETGRLGKEISDDLGTSDAREVWRRGLDRLDEKNSHRRFRRLMHTLKHRPSLLLSRKWLMSKYGLLPTMLDIYNMANFTGNFFDGITFVGRAKREEDVREKSPRSLSGGTGMFSYLQGRSLKRARISVTASVVDSATFDRARLASLNPLSIAWELTTLSFVVDWFYDIGSYLQNMEAALGSGLTFTRGYVTQLALNDVVNTWGGHEHSQIGFTTRDYDVSDTARVYAVKKQRTVLLGFPWPQLPRLEVKLGAQRIISAAALARTILLGKH
jgi:hypothetical protein